MALLKRQFFMPVGTAGTVKGVHQKELKEDINPDVYSRKYISFIPSARFGYFRKSWWSS